MDFPNWTTSSDLGTYDQDYSFDLNPLILSFSADLSSKVFRLNGDLPAGLSWVKIGSSIAISGVCKPRAQRIESRITFRIQQTNGAIADRTFFMAIIPPSVGPSWAGQDRFLGYQSTTQLGTYQLRAIPPQGQHVIYSLVTSPTGMNINPITGILTYDASNVVGNQTVGFNVRAQGSTVSNDIDLAIGVVSSGLEPRWVTAAGAIENPSGGITFPGNEFIEVNVQADPVIETNMVYSLVSSGPGFPLTISQTGSVYGLLPNPLSEQTYEFSANATTMYGTNVRSFSVTVVPSELYSRLVWITDGDLGSIEEGQYVEIPFVAKTIDNRVIVYNVTGGMLPPHLLIQRTAGKLFGFCEYHPVNKVYYFDITATDGYQYVTKQFKLEVKKKYSDQFFGAYIPLTGPLRDRWSTENDLVRVREPGSSVIRSIEDPIDPPYLNIINGLITNYDTPEELVSNAAPWLHTLDLRFGTATGSNVLIDGQGTLFRNIVDLQSGANTSVYSSSVYNTNVQTSGLVTPINIENIRLAWGKNRGYIGGGSGNGTMLSPVIDWSDGSISSIDVIRPGAGYRSRPEITVTGSGVNGRLLARVGLISLKVVDTGQGWNLGDAVEVPGNADTSKAVIRITNVDVNGSVSDFAVDDPGDYLQISSSYDLVITKGSASMVIRPVWGVVGVDVIDGGLGYQCGIELGFIGGEILPAWQRTYYPVMEIGNIQPTVLKDASDILNGYGFIYGVPWQPSYMVMQWQGLRWFGETTFDDDLTSFDGRSTSFQETEDPSITVFDRDQTIFDSDHTVFDVRDPLAYDLFDSWGSTLIDGGSTVFDLYSTVFDALGPRRTSRTSVKRWITMQNRVYSGNNVVW